MASARLKCVMLTVTSFALASSQRRNHSPKTLDVEPRGTALAASRRRKAAIRLVTLKYTARCESGAVLGSRDVPNCGAGHREAVTVGDGSPADCPSCPNPG